MFRSKRKTEFVAPSFFKDWANANAELESLGRRLDAVRGIISDLKLQNKPENHWAVRHWRDVEAIVLRRWKHTVRLKDVGLRQITKEDGRPKISYDWWEFIPGVGYGFTDRLFDRFFGQTDLQASWENAREQKLQKARQGLA